MATNPKRSPFLSTCTIFLSNEPNMSTPTTDLGDLICEHLTFCYASGKKRDLVKMAKEMGATYEQIIAASLAQHISERFDILPKAQGDVPPDGRSLVE